MFNEQQKQIILSAVIFGLLLLGGIYYYNNFLGGKQFIVKSQEDIEVLDEDITALKKKINEYKNLKAREPQILAWEKQVKEAAHRLPRNPDESQFHKILTEIMKETNVYPVRVEKLEPNVRDVYTEIPYKLECFVKYHNFGELINAIEENPDRFMRVKEFDITSESNVLKDRPSVQHATLTIATYSFNPRPE